MAPPAPTHDYYVTLEVLPTALRDEIKASYRRLARLHHPDKNIGCRYATAKTQLVSNRSERTVQQEVCNSNTRHRSMQHGKSLETQTSEANTIEVDHS
jgi:hypothetical protein